MQNRIEGGVHHFPLFKRGEDNLARLSKCKGCEKELSKEEKYVYSNKTYCKKCYEQIQIEHQAYDLLLRTICEYYSIDKPTGLMLKQIKDYKEQFNYTYNGITYALWYIKAIENRSFSEIKYGIALVKYYYEKAKQYFNQQQRISNSVKTQSDTTLKINEVKVNLNKVYKRENNFLIDIDSLIKENK